MKKKRILLGLTLAGAAFLALASCSKDKDNKKEDTSTSEVVSSSEAKSSSSEAKSSSSEATNKVTVKFATKCLDGAESTYFNNLEVNVDKGGKVSKPTTDPTLAGYEFLGYYTSATLATEVDFDTVTYTTNKTIYCAFDKLTDYHTKLAAAADNQYIIAEDFNAGTALTKGGFGATAAITDASSGDVAGVTMNAFAADVIGDGQADGKGERGKLDIGFGGVQSTSVVKGYFEFNLLSFKKDIFIGFIGAKKTATDEFAVGDDYKVINLGTNNAGSGARYKYNDEDVEVTLPGLEFEASKTYRFEYEIDTVAKKIKMYVDGTQVELSNASDKSFDYSAIDVTGIKGVQVTSLGSAVGISVNNVLVEVKEQDVSDAKTNAINAVKAYASNEKYTYLKDAIDQLIDEYTNETTGKLVAATTIAQVSELKEEADAKFANLIKDVTVTVKYYTAANTSIGDGKDKSLVTEIGKVYSKTSDELAISGYAIDGLYTDSSLETEYTGAITSAITIYAKVHSTDLVTTDYTFAWSAIKANLTTSAYYYTEKISADDATKRFQYEGQDLLCYDKIKLTTETLSKAFSAKVDGTDSSSTAKVSIGDGAEVLYRDGVRGKDGTLTCPYCKRKFEGGTDEPMLSAFEDVQKEQMEKL